MSRDVPPRQPTRHLPARAAADPTLTPAERIEANLSLAPGQQQTLRDQLERERQQQLRAQRRAGNERAAAEAKKKRKRRASTKKRDTYVKEAVKQRLVGTVLRSPHIGTGTARKRSDSPTDEAAESLAGRGRVQREFKTAQGVITTQRYISGKPFGLGLAGTSVRGPPAPRATAAAAAAATQAPPSAAVVQTRSAAAAAATQVSPTTSTPPGGDESTSRVEQLSPGARSAALEAKYDSDNDTQSQATRAKRQRTGKRVQAAAASSSDDDDDEESTAKPSAKKPDLSQTSWARIGQSKRNSRSRGEYEAWLAAFGR